MDLDRFKSHRSGRLVEIWYEDRLCLAFVPHPLPPDVALNDPQLQLTLSDADRALGELAGLGRNMPNPQLLVSPFIRREAVLSSRIEGTQTDIEELYVFESGQSSLSGKDSEAARADRLEVANYVHALEYGIEKQLNSPVNLDLVRELHGILMKGVRGEKVLPGEFRSIQNWIGRGGRGIRSARYVPHLLKS